MGNGNKRNKPCDCGSGKKSKNCCARDLSAITMLEPDKLPLPDYHQVLFAYLENGRYGEIQRFRDIPTNTILRRFFTLRNFQM